MNTNGRKVSAQHQTTQLLLTVHYHEDGEICLSSIGMECPLGDLYDQPIPGEIPTGMKLPNGFNLNSLFRRGSNGHLNGSQNGLEVFPKNNMLASMLSTTYGLFETGDMMSALDVETLARIQSGFFGSQIAEGDSLMASLTSIGNPILALTEITGNNPMTTLSRGDATMAKMKTAMAQALTDMQIAKTVENSYLTQLSDTEVLIMTDGQFRTTKDFIAFMRSSTTGV